MNGYNTIPRVILESKEYTYAYINLTEYNIWLIMYAILVKLDGKSSCGLYKAFRINFEKKRSLLLT